MPHSWKTDPVDGRNTERRRTFIRRWAAYVKSHDDAEWSRQQNRIIDSQLQTANEHAAQDGVDAVGIIERVDRLADR